MKPFNLEEAKAGKPVCTRNGLDVQLGIFNRNHPYYSIVGIYSAGDRDPDFLGEWTCDGCFDVTTSNTCPYDLFMKSTTEKRCLIYSTRDQTCEEKRYNSMHLQGLSQKAKIENVVEVLKGDYLMGKKYIEKSDSQEKNTWQIIEFEVEV